MWPRYLKARCRMSDASSWSLCFEQLAGGADYRVVFPLASSIPNGSIEWVRR